MKYPIQNYPCRCLLHATDALLSRILPKQQLLPRPIRRVLICNGAHLGDVLLSTSLIEPFKHLELGMLVGSWARPVIDGHPQLHHIHTVDHWKLNRTPKSRLRNYLRTRRQALRELRAVNYDLAIDCALHFPSVAPLLWQAAIPYRIGFESAGLSPFLTKAHSWTPSNHSVIESYAEMGGGVPCYSLPPYGPSRVEGDYVVIHMGVGMPAKKWNTRSWRQLARRLSQKNLRLVFTGQGEHEKREIATVVAALPTALDLCDALNWKEFVSVIASARLLISLDTAAAHVAAATRTPQIQLYSGNNPPELWKPLSPFFHQILLSKRSIEKIYTKVMDIYWGKP